MRNFALNEDLLIAGGYQTPEGNIVLQIGDPDGTRYAVFNAMAQERCPHHVLPYMQAGVYMPATVIAASGAELHGFTIGAEPEPAQSVPAATPRESTTMDNATTCYTVHDLLERVTSLAAVVAERAPTVRVALERAAAGELSTMLALANELTGDVARMHGLSQAAATIMQELRGRG